MTAAALSNEIKSLLTRAGAENPAGDASLIIENALGLSRIGLILNADTEVSPRQAELALGMAKRRAAGEPIQYILGSWTFMGREYFVGKGVLIPRDDTEVVVNAAIDMIKGVSRPCIVDLCSGSGIIAIALYHALTGADISAVEKSPEAYAYLERNAQLNSADIRLINADLSECAGLFDDGSIDLLISNPPYIPSAELPGLQAEVQREPQMALDGGESGLDFYRDIIDIWLPKLKKCGVIAFELGEKQYEAVAAMLRAAGCSEIRGYPDIQGITRATTAIKN